MKRINTKLGTKNLIQDIKSMHDYNQINNKTD